MRLIAAVPAADIPAGVIHPDVLVELDPFLAVFAAARPFHLFKIPFWINLIRIVLQQLRGYCAGSSGGFHFILWPRPLDKRCTGSLPVSGAGTGSSSVLSVGTAGCG